MQISQIEWDDSSINKRDWGDGPWLNEPDKLQFVSEGLPCLIVRVDHGSLCGYVGVPPSHPAYGLSYDGIPQLTADIIHAQYRDNLKAWDRAKDQFPDLGPEPPTPSAVGEAILDIRVHGGLTYSGPPTSISPAAWHDLQAQFPKAIELARTYPNGEAARWMHKWTPAMHSYEAFQGISMRTSRCFEPLDEEVWLFGFDCAHAFDLMPAMEARMKAAGIPPLPHFIWSDGKEKPDVYRTLEYVEAECISLATQLTALAALSTSRREGTPT